MRILLTIAAVGEVYGGPSKVVLELAAALGQQGMDVDVVTTNANGGETLDAPTQSWIQRDHYRIQYFPCYCLSDYKISPLLAQWCWHNLHHYAVVHTHAIFSLTTLPFYWICRSKNIPYLATPHGMLEPWALAYKAWKKKFYFRLLEKPALDRAGAIQAIASTEYENLRLLNLKSKVIQIPNGVQRADFEQLPSPQLFYQSFPQTQGQCLILFLGRIDPKKGLDLLAEAFAQVHRQFPNTHLVVAGPDNTHYQPRAEQFFRNFGCLNAVTFTGMLTGELKYAALSAANLYVSPSYSEGFSRSVLEGMAAGLPCVITTGCNFPEAVATQTAQVVAIQADAIAQGLVHCLTNLPVAQAMGQRARQFVLEHYAWDRIAQQFIEAYRTIQPPNAPASAMKRRI